MRSKEIKIAKDILLIYEWKLINIVQLRLGFLQLKPVALFLF